jgi:hypothetical protein
MGGLSFCTKNKLRKNEDKKGFSNKERTKEKILSPRTEVRKNAHSETFL